MSEPSGSSSSKTLARAVFLGDEEVSVSSDWPQEAQNLAVAEADLVPQLEQYLVILNSNWLLHQIYHKYHNAVT